MALRFDSIRLDASKITRTPAGLARVDAIIAKPGVYTYTNPDGSKVREYLPAEEIARADSLASAADATVTKRHPSQMVTPETWGGVSIGHVSGQPTATPEGARASLLIARKDALEGLGKDLVEVSRGVNVRIDETPGVTPEGERYDRVQRDIVYNHIALGPPGWGRQGASVSLRLDSGDNEIFENERTDTTMLKIKLADGTVREFKNDSELQAYYDGLAARTDAFPPPKSKDEDEEEEKKKKAEKKDAEDKLAAEKARADAATAELAKIKRTELETSARKVLGAEAKFDAQGADGKPVPMTDRAVREAVIKRLDSNAKLDAESDEYVRVRYDIAIAQAPASSNRSDAISAGLRGVRVDGSNPGETPKPRADIKMRQDANEAWKKNTGAVKL